MYLKILFTLLCTLLFISCIEKNEDFSQSLLKQKKEVIMSNDAIKNLPAFIALPPGVVKPRGWISDWAETSLSGITGHIDEWSPTFGEAWKGVGFKAMGANEEDGTYWPLEQSSYWLDGAIRLAYIMNDTMLTRKVSDRLDMVVNGVLNGGGTFIYWKPDDFLKDDGFNNWAHSHMGRALVAYYQATGKKQVLDALVKVYSNYQVPIYSNSFETVSGIVNIDPMLDTYMISGDKRILDQVLRVADDSLFVGVANSWIQGDINNGHGVITYENIRVPALLYPWTGNKQLMQATLSCFNWLDENHMLPCGVASSEEDNAGIGSTRNIETCNVAASAWSYQKMYEISGNANWGDRLERVFFNAAPVPVDRDFQTMSYYQSLNKIDNIIPLETPDAPGNGESSYVYRPLGHKVLCCVGNLNRVIPNYIMHMWMATLDDGIAATLYGPSEISTTIKDIAVGIISETNYPFGEDIKLIIEPKQKVAFPLHLRIPEWCENPIISVNQEKENLQVNENGFVVINREWKKGDIIDIKFPMKVEIISGNETPYPQTDYFKENRELAKLNNINNPYKSIFYGPLLFALPLKDENANTQVPNQKWNFALSDDENGENIELVRNEMPPYWRWDIDSPVKLDVAVKIFDWTPTELQPLPKEKVSSTKDTVISLVPYGSTKFRISMFPVSQ